MARPEVTVGAVSSATRWAAIGAILAGAADPRVRGGRGHLRPGRSVPAHPPDVPPRPPADPRPDRLSAGLAHDARLPRAARPPVADISAARAIARYRGPVLLAHGDADQVVPRQPHGAPGRGGGRGPRSTRPPTPRPGRDARRRRRPALLAVRGPDLPGDRRAVPDAPRSAGRSTPDDAAAIAAATHAERIPDGEERFAAAEDARRLPDPRPRSRLTLRPTTTRHGRPACPPRPTSRVSADERAATPSGRPSVSAGRSGASPTDRSSAAHLERILQRRPARQQLQEPAALGVHRVSRPRAPAAS